MIILIKRTITLVLLVIPLPFLSAQVELSFDDPETFTDFEYGQTRETITKDFFSKKVISRLEKVVAGKFPEGAVLTIHFSDIDLAGGFEPWQRIPLDDVRFFRDRYPAKLVFTYRLVDSREKLVAEGEEQLRDLGFQNTTSRGLNSLNPFYLEHRLLERWVKSKLLKGFEVQG
jgi:hypothetical protein